MTIIAVATSKGGAGKTTTTACLATSLATEGLRVAVVDADPNQGFARWHREVYEGPSITVHAETDERPLVERMIALNDTHDVVFVDTAGFGNRLALLAVTAADAAIIPSQSGRGDILEAAETVNRVAAASKSARREIPYRVLLTRIKTRTSLAQHATSEVDAAQLARFGGIISDLTAYQELTFTGRVPLTGRTGGEINGVVQEMRQIGWLPKQQEQRTADAIE
jgi:chromosome partitioning protein